MRNEVLSATYHPRQVADAQLPAVGEHCREKQAGRIAERLHPPRWLGKFLRSRQATPDRLGLRQVETQKLASVARWRATKPAVPRIAHVHGGPRRRT